ncbi:hypothetical protein [Azospirillum argentinense]
MRRTFAPSLTLPRCAGEGIWLRSGGVPSLAEGGGGLGRGPDARTPPS